MRASIGTNVDRSISPIQSYDIAERVNPYTEPSPAQFSKITIGIPKKGKTLLAPTKSEEILENKYKVFKPFTNFDQSNWKNEEETLERHKSSLSILHENSSDNNNSMEEISDVVIPSQL